MSSEATPKKSKKGRKILFALVGLTAIIIIIVAFSSGGENKVNTPGSPIQPSQSQVNVPAPAPATSHNVVYRVTGSGSLTYVTYNTDGLTTMNQEANVDLPWEHKLSLPANRFMMISITAQGASPDARVDLVVEVDGKLFKESHATGYGVAMASGTLER